REFLAGDFTQRSAAGLRGLRQTCEGPPGLVQEHQAKLGIEDADDVRGGFEDLRTLGELRRGLHRGRDVEHGSYRTSRGGRFALTTHAGCRACEEPACRTVRVEPAELNLDRAAVLAGQALGECIFEALAIVRVNLTEIPRE